MPPPMIAIEVRRAMFIPHACACWTRRPRHMRVTLGPSKSESRNQLLCCRFLQWVLNGFEGCELGTPASSRMISSIFWPATVSPCC